jgi:hypothetical protein
MVAEELAAFSRNAKALQFSEEMPSMLGNCTEHAQLGARRGEQLDKRTYDFGPY